MAVNEATLKLIVDAEGWRPKWYKDPVGIWTVGYGHTDAAGDPKHIDTGTKTFTKAEGEWILRADLLAVGATVLRLVKVPIDANQYGALVSFTYNLGSGNLEKSTLLKKVNAKDWVGAANEFKRWNRAGGKVLPGLTKRRAAEAALFAAPVPAQPVPAPPAPATPAEPETPATDARSTTSDRITIFPKEKPMEDFELPLAPQPEPGPFRKVLTGLVGKTVIRYATTAILGAIGFFLTSRGLIGEDTWASINQTLERALGDGVMVALGGGAIGAVITAMLGGVKESAKDKVQINGKRVELRTEGDKAAVAKTLEDRVAGR